MKQVILRQQTKGCFVLAIAAALLISFTGCYTSEADNFGKFKIKSQDLPVAEPETDYNFYLRGKGGLAPYKNWTVTLGALPQGFTLSNSGRISGVVPDEAGLYPFVVEATDADIVTTTDDELFVIRIGDPAQSGPLLLKANSYEELYSQRHSPSGLALVLINPDEEAADWSWTGYENAAFQTGLYLAAASFRYAQAPEEQDLETVTSTLTAIENLLAVSGKAGLLAKGFARDTDQVLCCDDLEEEGCDEDNLCGTGAFAEYHKGEGDFADYHWVGDAGADDYTAIFFGLSVASQQVEDESIRSRVSTLMAELMDHIWNNGLTIEGIDGETNTGGDLSNTSDGFDSLVVLSLLQCANEYTEDARFRDYRDELLEQGYLTTMKEGLGLWAGYDTDWRKVHTAMLNIFHLILLEGKEIRENAYLDILNDYIWVDGEDGLSDRAAMSARNPFFHLLYEVMISQRIPVQAYDTVTQQMAFPDAPRTNAFVDGENNPDIEKNPDRDDLALDALDITLMPPAPYQWDQNPYILSGGADDGSEFPGVDTLIVYWMARHYRYLGPDL